MSAERLLIVKFGAIGDCVMAIPAAYAMHQRGFVVDWVCGEAVAPVLRLYPFLNVIAVDDRALLRGSTAEKARAMLSLWRLLARHRYDVAATLYYDSRYKLLTLPVRAGRKVMLSKDDRRTRLLPGRHHTDEYARILLNRPDDEMPAQMAPVPTPSLPPSALASVDGKQRVVIVAGGARNMLRDDSLRRWPVENYVELARLLLDGGHEVVLAGGPDDAWTTPYFSGLPVTDLTGKLSLVETLALMESAALTITHDSGPLHLAGITRTAILTIFGPTDPRGRLPQRANCVAYWGGEGFACRPCYDGRDYADCSHNGCIRQVTPVMAFAEAATLLAAVASGEQQLPRIVTPPHTPLNEWVTL